MIFFDIYDKHYSEIKRFIAITVKDAWIADDLTQETFLRVERKLDTLEDPSKVRSWIYRIAYNLCQDYFRADSRSGNKVSIEDHHAALIMSPSVVKDLEKKEMGSCVHQQMGLLPESQKTVIELYEIMGLAQKEIAEILGISVENVKVRLHRARKNLKVILNNKCTFERDERDILVCVPKTENQIE